MINCREKNYYPDRLVMSTGKPVRRPSDYRPKNCRDNIAIAYDRSRHPEDISDFMAEHYAK